MAPRLSHSNSPTWRPIKTCSQDYINGFSSQKKKIFLAITTCMLVIDLAMNAINPLSIPSEYRQTYVFSNYILLPVASFLYIISSLKFETRSPGFHFADFLPILKIISCLLLCIHVFVTCFYRTLQALNADSMNSWINTYNTPSQFIYLFMLLFVISPTPYLKPLMVVCYYTSIIAAYAMINHPKLWYLVIREAINLLFTMVLVAFQHDFKWNISMNGMGFEDWNIIYKDILDSNPSYIAVLDIAGKLKYSNKGFDEVTNKDMDIFFKSIKNLKLRDLFGNCMNQTMANQDPSSPLFPPDGKQRLIAPGSFLHKKMSTKDTKNTIMTFENLSMLINHYRTLLNRGQFDNEDQIIFDGKLEVCAYSSGNFAPVRDGQRGSVRQRQTLSYEVIIRPLKEYKSLIIALSDTTERDLLVSLENNSDYKDKVLASVSHELRTPLNWNLGFLQRGLDDPQVPSSLKTQFLVPAFRSGKILSHVIDDIMDYSHMQAGKIKLNLKEKSLKDTLSYCHELMGDAFKAKKLGLDLNFGKNLPELFRTDHERLAQIMLNLLSNALKFTLSGGVTIEANWLEDSTAEIKVKDTGIGIRKESLCKLFDEEVYNKRTLTSKDLNSKGVGLGLKVAHKLWQILEGDEDGGIQVHSEYGEGSAFSFTLKHKNEDISSLELEEIMDEVHDEDIIKRPHKSFTSLVGSILSQKEVPHEHLHEDEVIYQKPAKDYFAIKRAHKRSSPKSLRLEMPAVMKPREAQKVLIVDDDSFNILVLESLLSHFGITIDSAINGKEAIQRVSEKPGGYRLIFMDCQMPVMDGFEATRLLSQKMKKGEIPFAPIIGCTAFSGQEKFKKCLKNGMKDVINKPVMKEKVMEILKKYMEIEGSR